jgi:hypothetical protein
MHRWLENTRDKSGHSGQPHKYRLKSVPTSHQRVGTTRDTPNDAISPRTALFAVDFASESTGSMSWLALEAA